jgi:hypothetical protein
MRYCMFWADYRQIWGWVGELFLAKWKQSSSCFRRKVRDNALIVNIVCSIVPYHWSYCTISEEVHLLPPDAEIRTLSDALVLEVVTAIGLPRTEKMSRLFRPVFHKPADRLAAIGVTADRMIAAEGFPAAASWMLTNWCSRVTARGTDSIPSTGPLLVISNHAGSYDTFVITSQLGRDDMKLIASDVPFLKNLPNASAHTIFLSEKTQDRTTAARAGMRHLQAGGALLLYGTGLIDPDPEVYPDPEVWIDKWLPSIDLFLRAAPDAKVVISIVSGVVAKRWAHHPITRIMRVDWQQRRLAEFSQVIQQLLLPGRFYLQPHISFSPPIRVDELRGESQGDRLLPAVIARGKSLLAEHLAWVRTEAQNGLQE